jgi:hypothetical protein
MKGRRAGLGYGRAVFRRRVSNQELDTTMQGSKGERYHLLSDELKALRRQRHEDVDVLVEFASQRVRNEFAIEAETQG